MQRKGNGTGPSGLPPIVHDVLRSPGQPLDPSARAFLSPRFGRDFSQVRVHRDARAAASAEAVGAQAYTVGRDIVFGEGRYMPHNAQGMELLAHELTHVVQQAGAASGEVRSLDIAPGGDHLEREADGVARGILKQSVRVSPVSAVDKGIQRQPAAGSAGSPLMKKGRILDDGKYPCTGSQGKISSAENKAEEYVKKAIEKIKAELRPGSNEPAVLGAIHVYFPAADNDFIRSAIFQIYEKVLRTHSALNYGCIKDESDVLYSRFDPKKTYRPCMEGNHPAMTEHGPVVRGQTEYDSTVYICPRFFGLSQQDRSVQILHEWVHVAGPVPQDIDTSDDPTGLPKEKAIGNPQSYAMLAAELSKL